MNHFKGFLSSVLCCFLNNFVLFTFRNLCFPSEILNNLLKVLLYANFLKYITHFLKVSKKYDYVFSI